LFRGAGDLASGAIRRAFLAGFDVVATELPAPLCVRRTVSFSEAVYEKSVTVEGVTARLADIRTAEEVLEDGYVAVVVDPDAEIRDVMDFEILVDSRIAKTNLGTTIDDAALVIGIGVGFTAGQDCHAVVESLGGHDLGRVLRSGQAAPDTGRAGPAESYLLPFLHAGSPAPAWDWDVILLRAPCEGTFEARAAIGDVVEAGQTVGVVNGEPVKAKVGGLLRGLIRPGTVVKKGLKLGDVDPVTGENKAITISEKSNAIGGGVLEAVLAWRAGRGGFVGE